MTLKKHKKSEQQIALEKNNAELDKLCKNICLIIGFVDCYYTINVYNYDEIC